MQKMANINEDSVK